MKILVLNPLSKSTKNVIRDLIYGCWCKGKRIGGAKAPPLNLLYIATILKEVGFDVDFKDAMAEQKTNFTINDYTHVIISTSMMSFSEDKEYLRELKSRNPELKTVIFGSHPTFMPDYCLRKPIDFIIMREPEFIVKELFEALRDNRDLKEVKGIGYRKGLVKQINLPAEFQDINELPIPDRTLLPKDVDYFNPIIQRMPYTTAMTSRGCPGKCTFCNVPDFYGNKFRFRSADKVIEEINQIVEQGYREIWFRDETFTAYPKRNKEICEYLIKNKVDITWIANGRVDMINKDMMELMKQAGCHMLKFGVESMDQQILDNVKKGTNVVTTRKVFEMANQVGMDTHAHVMLGMPGDGDMSIRHTIDEVKELNPTTATFGICTPYAGTPLFEMVKSKAPEIADGSSINLENLHTSGYYNEYFTSLKPKELEKLERLAYRKFYFRPTYIFKMLRKINNADQLKRMMLAGTKVFEFGVGK